MYLQGRPEQQVPCYLTRLQKPHVQTVMNNLVESFHGEFEISNLQRTVSAWELNLQTEQHATPS